MAERIIHSPTGVELRSHHTGAPSLNHWFEFNLLVHMKLEIPTPDLINQDSLLIPALAMK